MHANHGVLSPRQIQEKPDLLCPEPGNRSKLAIASERAVLASMLWNDDSGEISEYALLLALILMLGIALISQTG